nr:hypothetical protein Datr000017 [Darna trima granulovirus]
MHTQIINKQYWQLRVIKYKLEEHKSIMSNIDSCKLSNMDLKTQLDVIIQIKKDYKRKTMHEYKMAKLENDPSESFKRLKNLRELYFNIIVDCL